MAKTYAEGIKQAARDLRRQDWVSGELIIKKPGYKRKFGGAEED